MEQVEGIDHPSYPRSLYVCRLKKGLYGMHQINCQYWQQFSAVLKELGFVQSAYDPCLFMGPKKGDNSKPHRAGLRYMPIQVDDIACLRENTQLAKANWEKFLDRLSTRFPIGDRGPLNWYCQQRISFRPDGTISHSHTRHIKAFCKNIIC